MIKYIKLASKFFDKGYLYEFITFVSEPKPFCMDKVEGTKEYQLEIYNKIVNKVYGEDFEYWNQWIDHKNYK